MNIKSRHIPELLHDVGVVSRPAIIMLLLHFLVLIAISKLGLGRPAPGSYYPHVTHGRFPDNNVGLLQKRGRRSAPERRQASTCNPGQEINVAAPKTNIFLGLTDDEAAAVTSFLHGQKSLNLTAGSNATR